MNKEVFPVSRPAVITLTLVDSVDTFDKWFAESSRDGVIDATELTQGQRLWKPIPTKVSRFHECAQGAIRALTGDGIYGEWFGRMVRESRRAEMRVVVRNDDDPSPAGPAGKKAA